MAWLKLEAAIDAIHNKRTAATSREQLYRVSNEGDSKGDARTSNGLFSVFDVAFLCLADCTRPLHAQEVCVIIHEIAGRNVLLLITRLFSECAALLSSFLTSHHDANRRLVVKDL